LRLKLKLKLKLKQWLVGSIAFGLEYRLVQGVDLKVYPLFIVGQEVPSLALNEMTRQIPLDKLQS